MFNGKRVYALENEVERLLLDVGCRVTHGQLRDVLRAGDRQVCDLSARLDALAAALGYEWVPEGKTAARWQKKAPSVTWRNNEVFEYGVSADGAGWYRKLEVDTPKRRKGDKKGGRK